MQQLYRQSTKSSPGINFNPEMGSLKITGQSYPEYAFAFYQEIFEWVTEYLLTPCTKTVVEFNLSYINTSSIKCLLDMIYMLEDACKGGTDIAINWYFDSNNRSMRECGEEFKEDLCMEFNIIPKE